MEVGTRGAVGGSDNKVQAQRAGYNFRMNARILVTTLALAGGMASGVSGCGQRGPLYLPTEPAAQDRATLPQILLPAPARKSSESP